MRREEEAPTAVMELRFFFLVVSAGEAHRALGQVLVHMLTTVVCLVPLLVVLVNGLFLRKPRNRLVQLCAVHFVWNAHVIGHCAMVFPFAVMMSHETEWQILYEVSAFWVFVCIPLEVSTGLVKSSTSRARIRFSWRHRAALGVFVCLLTASYFIGTYYVRGVIAFRVSLYTTFLFYAYAGASYLPQNPQGDGPEITGSREWPWLKTFLQPILWDPITHYMRLKLVVDDAHDDDDDDTDDELLLRSLAQEVSRLRKRLPPGVAARRADHALGNAAAELLRTARRRRRRRPTTSDQPLLDDDDDDDDDQDGRLLGPDETALFGFHVHGIIPFNAALMTLLPEWPRRVSKNRIVLATDAMTHVIAWLRDLGQWLGVRECTRACIAQTLDQETSVVLVPGGQAEMFCSNSRNHRVDLYVGHRGFLRLALEKRVRLVPVFSFGEWLLMDNVRFCPSLQRLTRKLLGLPLPFLPYGALPGIPRRPATGITVVVGAPIDPEPFLSRGDAGTRQAVSHLAIEALHAEYYSRLERLFDKHKSQAGYPDATLRKLEHDDLFGTHKKVRIAVPKELARNQDSYNFFAAAASGTTTTTTTGGPPAPTAPKRKPPAAATTKPPSALLNGTTSSTTTPAAPEVRRGSPGLSLRKKTIRE